MQYQQNLSDQDFAQLILDHHKFSAQGLTTMALECTNESLRNEVINALQTTLNHQQLTWQVMSHQGWYQAVPANQQLLSQAQQAVNRLPRFQHASAGKQTGYFGSAEFQTQPSHKATPDIF